MQFADTTPADNIHSYNHYPITWPGYNPLSVPRASANHNTAWSIPFDVHGTFTQNISRNRASLSVANGSLFSFVRLASISHLTVL